METSEQQNLPQARMKVPHPYLALMGLYLGGFAGMYSETALNIALPQLSEAFGVELALTQWLVVGYMLVIGIVLPFTSLLMKWFSARKITLFALGAFLVGSVISGLAPNFEVCLAGRAIQGIGTGLVLPLMFSMVMEVIPPHKIGSAMGVNALVIMSASAIGPTLAGLLVGALSWRAIFFSFAVVLFVGLVFTVRFCVNPYELTKPRIDALSVVTSCLGFGGIVLGAGIASLYGWGSAPTIAALAVGIVGLAIYARRQLGMEAPIIDLRVFKVRGFLVGALCVMLNFGITLSIMFVLPQFYQNAMALPVSFAGLIMLPGGIVNAAVSALAGRLFDRVGARVPGMAGFGLSIVGAVLLLFATPQTPLAYLIVCHIILMVGVPLAMSPCQTYALASLPHNLSTDGSTMLNTMQQVLGAVCTAVATFLLATGQGAYLSAGGADSAAAFAQGSHLVFAFALALATISFALACRIKALRGAAVPEGAPVREDAGLAAGEAQPLLAQLMKTPVFTISEDATALDALKLFAEKGISGAPVVDGSGKMTGFVSDGDIISTMSRQTPAFTDYYSFVADTGKEDFDDRLDALIHTAVGQLATRNVMSVQVDDDMRDVCALLAGRHLKKAPVMRGDEVVGIIDRSNITRHAVERYIAQDALA